MIRLRRPCYERLNPRYLLTVNATLLADINIGDASSLLDTIEWVELNGHLYFAADDGFVGNELWRTDGTSDGTELVADIHPLGGSFPTWLTAFKNEVYFAATGPDGDELWKTDGTESGTIQVADIRPGEEGSFPHGPVVFDDRLYFSAITDDEGDELWRTDGTTDGTEIVIDLNPGPADGSPQHFYVFKDELYLSGIGETDGPELYKTDGTEAGTILVKDIHEELGFGSFPESFFEFKNELYFIAADGLIDEETLSSHLFKTDGTDEGTVKVTPERLTINLNAEPNVVEFEDHLYFGGIDGANRWELFRTNGTAGNSELVVDLSGAFSSAPAELTRFNDELYFAANDETGRQLWRSNGIPGEDNISERVTNVSRANSGTFPSELLVYQDRLFWNGHDGETFQVWSLNGNEAEPVTQFKLNPTSEFFSLFVPFGERLVFRGSGAEGLELWSLQVEEDPAASLPGDVNGDGKVDFSDFLVISNNFAKDVDARTEGDLDGNGKVDFADFLEISDNFGAAAGQPSSAFARQVDNFFSGV